jgi:hypothetical protein
MGSISARRSGLGAWTAAAICVVASIAGPARATLLWNDAFDLPPYLAANVNGQSGGTGTFFTGPWEGVNAADITADDQLILETSLTMPGLIEPSTGGALGDNDTTGLLHHGPRGPGVRHAVVGSHAAGGLVLHGLPRELGIHGSGR